MSDDTVTKALIEISESRTDLKIEKAVNGVHKAIDALRTDMLVEGRNQRIWFLLTLITMFGAMFAMMRYFSN